MHALDSPAMGTRSKKMDSASSAMSTRSKRRLSLWSISLSVMYVWTACMVVEPYLLQCVNNLNVDVSVNSDAYEPYLFGSNVYVIMYLSTYACVILMCCCPLVLKDCSSMTLLCTIIYLLKLSIFYKLYGNGPLQHVHVLHFSQKV